MFFSNINSTWKTNCCPKINKNRFNRCTMFIYITAKKCIFVWCIDFYISVPKYEKNMFREKCKKTDYLRLGVAPFVYIFKRKCLSFQLFKPTHIIHFRNQRNVSYFLRIKLKIRFFWRSRGPSPLNAKREIWIKGAYWRI